MDRWRTPKTLKRLIPSIRENSLVISIAMEAQRRGCLSLSLRGEGVGTDKEMKGVRRSEREGGKERSAADL